MYTWIGLQLNYIRRGRKCAVKWVATESWANWMSLLNKNCPLEWKCVETKRTVWKRRQTENRAKKWKKMKHSKVCHRQHAVFCAFSTFVVLVVVIIHSLHVFKFAYNRAQLELQTATFVNERQSEHVVCFTFFYWVVVTASVSATMVTVTQLQQNSHSLFDEFLKQLN